MPNLTSQWKPEPNGLLAPRNPLAAGPVWSGHGSFRYRDWIYFMGGDDGVTVFSDIFRIRVAGDGSLQGQWQFVGNLPNPTNPPGVFGVQVYRNKLFVIGGEDVGIFDSVWVATIYEDGTIGGWQNQNPMPSPMSNIYYGTVIASNGFLYVGGGGHGGVEQRIFYAKLMGDGSLGPWQSQLVFPDTAHLTYASIVEHNGYLFISGGGLSQDIASVRLNTDGSLGPWRVVGALSTIRGRHSVIKVQGHLLFVGGTTTGGSGAAQATTEFVRLEGGGLCSAPIPGPPTPIITEHSNLVAVGDLIYMISYITNTGATARKGDIFVLNLKW